MMLIISNLEADNCCCQNGCSSPYIQCRLTIHMPFSKPNKMESISLKTVFFVTMSLVIGIMTGMSREDKIQTHVHQDDRITNEIDALRLNAETLQEEIDSLRSALILLVIFSSIILVLFMLIFSIIAACFCKFVFSAFE